MDNKMGYWRQVFRYALLCCNLIIFAAAAKSITVVSGQWPGNSQDDGHGRYFDLFREVMASQDIQIQTRTSNWKRAKHMFHAGRADVLLGDYKSADPALHFPVWQLDMDAAVVLFSTAPVLDLQQLNNKSIGWLLGYDFDQFLPVAVIPYEVTTHSEGFSLLARGRLDGYIGYQQDAPTSGKPKLFSYVLQQSQAIYPVFKRDFSGRQLAKAYDQGMLLLYQNGRLAELFGAEAFASAQFAEKARSIGITSRPIP